MNVPFRSRDIATLRTVLLAGLLAFAVAVSSAPPSAVADGGGGGGDDRKVGAPAKQEDPDYTAAVKRIKAKDFGTAIQLLEGVVARDASNADAYNWLGYATRKNGEPARAISIYEKALAVDPKHRGAHEYIGEAYLILGDLARAKEHLAVLNKLCFFPCEEYADLKKAVQAYEASAGRSKRE